MAIHCPEIKKEGIIVNQIDHILNKIKDLLLTLGFKRVEVNGEINYVYHNIYCIPHYIHKIGFLIEYADSFEEAQNNLHEDGDSFR